LKIENLGVSDMSNRYGIAKNNKLIITIHAEGCHKPLT